MRPHMAVKLMCKLLYVLEINLFEMLLLVMYIFVSVNLKPPHPLPMPTGEEVLPENWVGALPKPLPYLRAKSIFFCYNFSYPVNTLTKNLIPYLFICTDA